MTLATDQTWSKTGASYYAGLFFGRSAITLGSNDIRTGGGFSYAFGRPEPQFKLWSIPAQLVYQVTVDSTQSRGGFGGGPNDRLGLGLYPYARYRGRTRHGVGLFVDLGFGLYLSDPSLDINSTFSTSPFAGLGLALRQRSSDEILIGMRFRHISNGGTRGPNAGQNGFFLTVEYRY